MSQAQVTQKGALTMLVIRPVTLADLPALEQLAEHAVPRLTNLPANRDRLEERIVRSQEAFESEIEYPGNEHYMFVLADDSRNEVLGTATIRAQAGAAEAYYTYRQETLIHASQQLNVRREVQTLALSHEASDATLLCALSLDPRYKGTSAESLLRRARLMFIAQYPERFSRILAVAFPGFLDSQNESPFWESVGRHFFCPQLPRNESHSGRALKELHCRGDAAVSALFATAHAPGPCCHWPRASCP